MMSVSKEGQPKGGTWGAALRSGGLQAARVGAATRSNMFETPGPQCATFNCFNDTAMTPYAAVFAQKVE